MKEHNYKVKLNWTGNQGTGTSAYKAYSRDHEIIIENKPIIKASSDTIFNGDAQKHNPEDMFVASIAACHMLWYLHLCADNSIIVTNYSDNASGTLNLGIQPTRFTEVVLNPNVEVADSSMIELATRLHHDAHQKCFIANSCNFPVRHNPICHANK